MIVFSFRFLLFIIIFLVLFPSCSTSLIKRTNEGDQIENKSSKSKTRKERTTYYQRTPTGKVTRIRNELGKEKDRIYQKEKGRKKKFTKEAIERTQKELKGEELKAFNESVEKFKKQRAGYDAKRYERIKSEKEATMNQLVGKRIKVTVSHGKRKELTESDARKANQVASQEIPFDFQPHKKSKGTDTEDLPQ